MIKRSTLVGWIMITLSIMLSVWVISSGSSHADPQTTSDGFTLSEDGTRVISYDGDGGFVSVPSGVITVDGGVFAGNSSITSVSFPASVTSMGSQVFSNCYNLSSVNLGSVSSIPASSFSNCYSLPQISLPSSVTSIGDKAFYGCDGLVDISLPSSVTNVSSTAFDECDNLSAINISPNGFYSSSDGALYNSDKTRLIMVPPGKSSIKLSDNATAIADDAFRNSHIDSVTIPSSVTYIGDQSGWNPSQIKGYSGSAAQQYANENGIPFIALDGGDSDGGDDGDDGDDGDYDDGDDGDDGDYDDPDDGDDGDDGDDSDSGSGNKKPGGNSGGSGGSGGGRSGNGGSTNGGRSGRSSGGKDATPKTADGDFDPRFALCLSLLMGGAGIIVLSRKRQMELVSERRPRN